MYIIYTYIYSRPFPRNGRPSRSATKTFESRGRKKVHHPLLFKSSEKAKDGPGNEKVLFCGF